MPWRERYTFFFFILALSTTLITQFILRGDYKHVNFDQLLRIKMPDSLLPQNAQMTVCSLPFEQQIPFLTNYEKGPYEQFILFGDSITQMSCTQDLGFAWTPALQNGEPRLSSITWPLSLSIALTNISSHIHSVYIRNLDVINRGFK